EICEKGAARRRALFACGNPSSQKRETGRGEKGAYASCALERDARSLLHCSGRRRRASQPRPRARFSSVSVPPCASAIWRESTRPIPDPPGFVVKKGTKRFAVFARPKPSSSTQISTWPPCAPHPTRTE